MKSKVWLYPGMAHSTNSRQAGTWYFTTIPKKQSEEIKKSFGAKARGWGSLPVSVTIGKTKWRTSIFPDRRSATYLLPLKAIVRKKEEIMENDTTTFSIEIL